MSSVFYEQFSASKSAYLVTRLVCPTVQVRAWICENAAECGFPLSGNTA